MTTTEEISTVSYAEALRLALDEAMAADDSVFVLGEDVGEAEGGGVFKVTSGLSEKYGKERVRSTPISEQAIVGAAIGAAIAGMRPVAEIMLMNFMTVAMDQIFNHAAKIRFTSGEQTTVPITIRMSCGAGAQFGSQHSDMLEAWLAHSPGLKVVIASTPADAKGLLTSCIFDDDPCVFLEPISLYYGAPGPAPAAGYTVAIGEANVVRTGSDVTLIGYGTMLQQLDVVARELSDEGVEAEVIDLRSLSPLDDRTVLESVAKTRRAVVAHEAVQDFGIGAEIASRIYEELFSELAAPVRRVGAPFTPVPYAAGLEAAYLPSATGITAAVRQTLD
jgi:pyruvate dehydrogenase E1 component beta subunit